MSNAASQAAAFYRDVADGRRVWTVRDAGGVPCPENAEGNRAMPFWSSEARAQHIVATVPAYAGFSVVPIPWEEFRDRWLPGLARDGLLVGVNWSGASARGYDVEPGAVRAAVEAQMGRDDEAGP